MATMIMAPGADATAGNDKASPVAAANRLPTVLCCMCGIGIRPNPTGMCAQCIHSQIDITEGIGKNLTIYQCRGCKRFLRPPWVAADLESRELLAICLRKISGLKNVKLIDATWIWTEPHSRRLKLRLTVQKEVANGAIIQQAFVVEFVVRNQQCDTCQASFTNNTWKAVVQVRQRVDHKRTFFYLEQLILKHNAHANCGKVETLRDGMDFFFTERSQAAKFVDFLENVVPVKVKHSKKLISADNHSNTFNFSFTYLVTVAPVCKNDLVLLPKRLAAELGSMPRLCLVQRVTDALHLVDPLTAQTAELSADRYWRHEFPPLLGSGRLASFVALGAEPLPEARLPAAPPRARQRRARRAAVTLAREDDLGSNDRQSTATTHLGHLIRAGDTLLCYDLTAANLAEDAGDALAGAGGGSETAVPDVVVVQKCYGGDSGDGGGSSGGNGGGSGGISGRQRAWRLRELEKEEVEEIGRREAAAVETDYERFLQQLEADKEMRQQVNLYRRPAAGAGTAFGTRGVAAASALGTGASAMETGEDGGGSEADVEEVRLEELLDDLMLDDTSAPPDDASAAASAASAAADGAAAVFAAGAAPAPSQVWQGFGEDDPDL
ncbi:unnamed protein product [Phaeothamnion confervicola]